MSTLTQKQLEAARAYKLSQLKKEEPKEEKVEESLQEAPSPEASPQPSSTEEGGNETKSSSNLSPEQIKRIKSYKASQEKREEEVSSGIWNHLKQFGRTVGRFGHKALEGVTNVATSDILDPLALMGVETPNKKFRQMAKKAIQPEFEKVDKATEDTLLSKGTQEFVDEAAKTFGEQLPFMFLGGSGAIVRPVLTSLAASFGGESAKEITKAFGGGDKAQTGAKIATMFLIGAIQPKGAKMLKEDLYSARDAAIKKVGDPLVKLDKNQMNKLFYETEIMPKKGIVLSSEKPAIEARKQLLKVANQHHGKIQLSQLVKYKRMLNEERGALWAKQELKGIKPSVKKNLDLAAKEADELIKHAFKDYPEQYNLWKRADAIHKVLEEGKSFHQMFDKVSQYGVMGSLVHGGLPAGAKTALGKKGVQNALRYAHLLPKSFKNTDLAKLFAEGGFKHTDYPELVGERPRPTKKPVRKTKK